MSRPRARQPHRRATILAATALNLILFGLLGAGTAQASALVRFVHAVPGVDTARLSAESGGGTVALGGGRDFGQASTYRELPAGSARLVLRGPNGSVAGSARKQLTDRARYTVVAMGTPRRLSLQVFRDGSAAGGVARVRMIHAVPELGKADVRLGRRLWGAGAGFTQATPYRSAPPGRYTASITRPGRPSDVLLSRDVTVTAGSSFTGIAIGSAGEQTRLVVLEDTAVTPNGAPQTGLGGLAAGEDGGGVAPVLPLAVLLMAGATAGLVRRSRTARRR